MISPPQKCTTCFSWRYFFRCIRRVRLDKAECVCDRNEWRRKSYYTVSVGSKQWFFDVIGRIVGGLNNGAYTRR